MLHENDLMLIEDYLDGELEGDALHAFEQRLKTDPELSNEMQLFKEVNMHLKVAHKEHKKKEWKAILNEAVAPVEKKPENKRRILYFISAAAAVALLFFGVFTLFPGTSSSNQLAQEYWEDSSSFLATSIERGNTDTDSQRLSEAFLQYKNNNYESALQILSTLENTNDESELLYAACFFQSDDMPQAIEKLLPLVNNPQSLAKDEAQWYLALAYLKDGQAVASRKLLNDIIARKAWNWKKSQSLLNQL